MSETPATPQSPSITTQTPADPTPNPATPASPEPNPAPETPPASLVTQQQQQPAPVEFTPIDVKDFTLPEGFEADDAVKGRVVELANKHKIGKESISEFVNLHAELVKEASERASQEVQELWTKWQDEAKNDPEIGGAKLEPALAAISKAIDKFNIPGLREAFDLTGAGNHPAIIKFMYKMAQTVTEGGPVSGTPGSSETQSAAQILYGKK